MDYAPPLTFHEYIHQLNLNTLILPRKLDWNASEIDVDACTLQFISSALYTYTVGKNTIEKKQEAQGI